MVVIKGSIDYWEGEIGLHINKMPTFDFIEVSFWNNIVKFYIILFCCIIEDALIEYTEIDRRRWN